MEQSRQLCLRVWFQTQDGLMVIKWSLKTGREKSAYFSRATNNKITVVLAWLRESIVGIYAQKKIGQIEEKEDF